MNEIRKIVTRLLLAVVISLVFGSATRLFDPLVFHTSSEQSNNEQTCPDGSTPDASGNCPTSPPPPAGGGETAPAAPPATETPPTSGCGPGTDNSTCSATPTPTPTPTPGNATASQGGNNITAADFVNTIL